MTAHNTQQLIARVALIDSKIFDSISLATSLGMTLEHVSSLTGVSVSALLDPSRNMASDVQQRLRAFVEVIDIITERNDSLFDVLDQFACTKLPAFADRTCATLFHDGEAFTVLRTLRHTTVAMERAELARMHERAVS